MSLTSSTTLAEAKAQYNNNLDWEGDITKATAAIEAVRWLLVNRPTSTAAHDGRQMSFETLQQEKEKLEDFINRRSRATDSHRCTFTRGHPIL